VREKSTVPVGKWVFRFALLSSDGQGTGMARAPVIAHFHKPARFCSRFRSCIKDTYLQRVNRAARMDLAVQHAF